MRPLEDSHIGRACGVHPGVWPEPAFHPLRVFKFQYLGHRLIAVIFQGMLNVRSIAQLLEIIAQAHPLNKTQRELRFFTAFQQLKHLFDGHSRRKAIGTGFEMRQFRLDT